MNMFRAVARWWVENRRWLMRYIVWPLVVVVIGGVLVKVIGFWWEPRQGGVPAQGNHGGEGMPAPVMGAHWVGQDNYELEVTWNNLTDASDLHLLLKDDHHFFRQRAIRGGNGIEQISVGPEIREVVIARLAAELQGDSTGIKRGHSGVSVIASTRIPTRQ